MADDDQTPPAGRGRADAVRAAVDQAFQATAQVTADAGKLSRERVADITDELVGNISRLREALDDARPATAEDLREVRAELAALSARVAALEGAGAAPAWLDEPPTAIAGRGTSDAFEGGRVTPAEASSAPSKTGAARSAPPAEPA